MTTLEIILIVILYVIMIIFTTYKSYKWVKYEYEEGLSELLSLIFGLFWPIVIFIVTFNKIIMEDW